MTKASQRHVFYYPLYSKNTNVLKICEYIFWNVNGLTAGQYTPSNTVGIECLLEYMNEMPDVSIKDIDFVRSLYDALDTISAKCSFCYHCASVITDVVYATT